MTDDLPVIITRDNSRLDFIISGWLHAKYQHSGSEKTKKAYESTLRQFQVALHHQGLDLDHLDATGEPRYNGFSERQIVTSTAQAFASWSIIPGKKTSEATHNQRLSILSSFYEYAIVNEVLAYNPIKRVERAKVQQYKSSKGLEPEATTAGLASIDRSTQRGKRDYAILSVLLATGRRVSEVAGLQWRDVYISRSSVITLSFPHLKGGKGGSDKLDTKTSQALLAWLWDYYGKILTSIAPDAPLWVSLTDIGESCGQQLSTRSFSNITKKYLGTGKVHTTRHTWTKNMLSVNAPLPLIQQKLGHASLATTGIYAQSLESSENPFIERIARRTGIE